jgi:hypothetical protein
MAPALPDEVVYGFGRMDVSGRVGDRAIIGVLGWQPGDRLTLTGAAGVVIALYRSKIVATGLTCRFR